MIMVWIDSENGSWGTQKDLVWVPVTEDQLEKMHDLSEDQLESLADHHRKA